MKRLLMLAGLSLLLAAPAFAQPAVEIVPMIGAYVPTGTLMSGVNELGQAMDIEHKTGFLFGARVDVWTVGNLGLEASASYAMSDLEASGAVTGTEDSSVFLGAAKLLYRLGVPGGPARFHLGGGLAMIKHGGDAFEDLEGTTDVGAVVGLGAAVSLPGTIGLRIDLEDYIYSAKFNAGDAETDSEMQNDIVLTAGLAFKLGM